MADAIRALIIDAAIWGSFGLTVLILAAHAVHAVATDVWKQPD